MKLRDFFYLGKIVKTHGLSGELSGIIDSDSPLSYTILKAVFFNLKEGIIPLPIEKINIEKNSYCIIKFKNINSIEEARRLVNKPMYLPLSILPKLSGKKFYYHEITDFKVVDNIKGEIGKITSVLDNPSQPIFQILFEEKEILVPAHDNIIEKIDRENKTIFLNCPEGLIDLYLEIE